MTVLSGGVCRIEKLDPADSGHYLTPEGSAAS